jgi:hypothetical protein
LVANLLKTGSKFIEPYDILLTLGLMKKGIALILSTSFFFSIIVMPYSNFDDTSSIRSVYQESQEEDNDIDVSEFILNKLLVVGQLFDQGDDDGIPQNHKGEPIQVLSLQSGSLYCNKITVVLKNDNPVLVKPTSFFKEDKFSFDFHASIFHPPAQA